MSLASPRLHSHLLRENSQIIPDPKNFRFPIADSSRFSPQRTRSTQRHGPFVDFSAASVTSAVNGPKKFAIARCLFEQLSQILKHGVFFVRLRAIGEKELLAQVQCLSLHCPGIKSIPYRTQEFISVHLAFSRIPCVTNRSRIELIEWYFRVPIELRDRVRDQPVLGEHDQVIGVHAIV